MPETGLIEADLHGHTIHGLALAPDHLEEIRTTALSIEDATEKGWTLSIGATAVRRSHHVGCLAYALIDVRVIVERQPNDEINPALLSAR